MDWQQYIQPELLILIPVLYFIGMGLKKATWLDDKHIPVSLGLIGMALAALWVFATSTIGCGQDICAALFTSIVQGILCAGGAVYADNIVKQNTTKG